jgi:hypothetical protein
MIKQGYLYAAIGNAYVDEAIRSVTSLKRINPAAHVTLFTQGALSSDLFDDVIQLDLEEFSSNRNEFGYLKDGFTFKIQAMLDSPYEQTFFVDTDTYFVDSCQEGFDLLAYYDFLISTDASDHTEIFKECKRLYAYLPYNTGIILFKTTDAVKRLLNEWLKVWKGNISNYPQDQPALMEAMLTCPVNVYVLPVNYNFRLQFFVSVKGKVKVLHGRHNNMPEAARRINVYQGQRMWDYQKQQLIHNNEPRDWKGRLINRLPKGLYLFYKLLKKQLKSHGK